MTGTPSGGSVTPTGSSSQQIFNGTFFYSIVSMRSGILSILLSPFLQSLNGLFISASKYLNVAFTVGSSSCLNMRVPNSQFLPPSTFGFRSPGGWQIVASRTSVSCFSPKDREADSADDQPIARLPPPHA